MSEEYHNGYDNGYAQGRFQGRIEGLKEALNLICDYDNGKRLISFWKVKKDIEELINKENKS